MKATVADLEAAIASIERTEQVQKKLLAEMMLRKIEAIDQFFLETLNKKAFPKIWGKPSRFSMWIRNIKLEIHKTNDPFAEKYILKQRGKIIGEKLIKITIKH